MASMATGTTYPGHDLLTGLRQLLRRLECRQMTVKQGSIDVTSEQIAFLRQEIVQLERTLLRLSGNE